MDLQILLLLGQDGITNGAIYALLALALVLVFAVTRVIFIPQGEFVAYGALTLAALQAGKVPGTIWLLVALGATIAVLDGFRLLREKRYEPEKFLRLASALHEKRDAPWAHFGPDTNYPPTKSTPLVWEDSARFNQEKDTFLAATDALLAAAKTQDEAKIQVAYDAVHASCQDCHKPFKTR